MKQALVALRMARHLITPQQYRTMRGQVLAGDKEGAMRGLQKILKKPSSSHQ